MSQSRIVRRTIEPILKQRVKPQCERSAVGWPIVHREWRIQLIDPVDALVQGCGCAGVLSRELHDRPSIRKRGGDSAGSLVFHDGPAPIRVPRGLKTVGLKGVDDPEEA